MYIGQIMLLTIIYYPLNSHPTIDHVSLMIVPYQHGVHEGMRILAATFVFLKTQELYSNIQV